MWSYLLILCIYTYIPLPYLPIQFTDMSRLFMHSTSVFSDLDNIKEVDICRKRPREGEYDVQSLSDFSRGEHSGPSKKRVKKRHLSILSLVSLVRDSPKGAKSALTVCYLYVRSCVHMTYYVCVFK